MYAPVRLSASRRALRERDPESAVFFADFNDAVMSCFTRESEALIKVDLIRAS